MAASDRVDSLESLSPRHVRNAATRPPPAQGLPRMPGHGLRVGPPAHLLVVRSRGLLRLLAQPPCHQALSRDVAPSRHLGRGRRDVGLLLPRRPVPLRGAMTPHSLAATPDLASRQAQMFPELSEVQLARIASFGTEVRYGDGAVIWEQGDAGVPMFVVLEGELEIVDPLRRARGAHRRPPRARILGRAFHVHGPARARPRPRQGCSACATRRGRALQGNHPVGLGAQ